MKTNIVNWTVVAIVLVSILAWCTPAKAQGNITQSQFNSDANGAYLSLGWGSDGTISLTTNGTFVGYDSNPLVAANSYTSDIWNIALTFSNGVVTVAASSTEAPGLYWRRDYQLSSTLLMESVLLGASYQANNGESMTISSVSINGNSVSGTATVGASQSFDGLMLNGNGPITSLDFSLGINTPSTWERQNNGLPALTSMIAFPDGVASVPEPSMIALLSFPLGAFLIRKMKKR